MRIDDNAKPSSNSVEKQFRLKSINLSPHKHQEQEPGLHFGQLIRLLRRRTGLILGITAITLGLVYVWASRQPKLYQGNFELWVQENSVESAVASSASQGSDSTNSESLTLKKNATLLNLLNSPKLLLPVVEYLQQKDPTITYSSLVQSLTLENPKNTDILKVTYENTDPLRVKFVLQAISKAYLNYSLQSRQTEIIQGIKFLDQQLPLLRDRVDILQTRIQTLRQAYNLSDPNLQSQQISEQTDSIQKSSYDNLVALKQARANLSDLKRQSQTRKGVPLASSALTENLNYQKIRTQLQDLDSQIDKASTLYTSDHPNLQPLYDQREKLQLQLNQETQQVIDELSSQIRGLEARADALNQTEDILNTNLKKMSLRTRQYNDLQRELQIATNNLTEFLSKREALAIEAAQREVPWVMTRPPSGIVQVSASTARSLLLGAIIGLLLGSGVALLIDKLKNVFYTPEELKADTVLPLLGILPFASEIKKQTKSENRDELNQIPTAMLESVRSLYTSICLYNIDTPIRSLTISSVCSNDGKTTVAIYLARIAASLGHKVLLVDADLRKPEIHKRLHLSNDRGLSDLMANEMDYKQVVQQIGHESYLNILTPGQIPPDPVNLLSSHKMAALMKQFEKAYDLVIYDTPPAYDLTDANLLATKTDGLALVIGLGNTDRTAFAETLESFKLSPVVVVGMIANGWKDAPRRYYQPLQHPKDSLRAA